MLGDPTKSTVDMYTDMDFIITKEKKTKHNHDHTLSYSWTYLAPLWVHSLHSLSTCERGENAKNTQPQFRFLPWQRERIESETKKNLKRLHPVHWSFECGKLLQSYV